MIPNTDLNKNTKLHYAFLSIKKKIYFGFTPIWLFFVKSHSAARAVMRLKLLLTLNGSLKLLLSGSTGCKKKKKKNLIGPFEYDSQKVYPIIFPVCVFFFQLMDLKLYFCCFGLKIL